jgi:hypothetical protein
MSDDVLKNVRQCAHLDGVLAFPFALLRDFPSAVGGEPVGLENLADLFSGESAQLRHDLPQSE